MKYCIIGLGNHARTKIYPSLNVNNTNIFSVTRNKKNEILNIKNFKNINLAHKKLGKECIYIISTPPKNHIKFLKYLIKNGVKNIYVEKPLLVKSKNISDIIQLKNLNQKIIEIFPYKDTLMFKYFYDYIKFNKNNISDIKIKFSIPKLPKNTFRDKSDLYSSLLFDIGCYPIELLFHLKLLTKFESLTKIKKRFFNNFYDISFISNDIKISISIGLSKIYKNYILLKNKRETKVKFDKFFYARKSSKAIFFYNKKNKISKNIILEENNSFNNYFTNYKKISINKNKIMLDRSFETVKFIENIIKNNS